MIRVITISPLITAGYLVENLRPRPPVDILNNPLKAQYDLLTSV